MCKLCEERIARNSGAATGAAMNASPKTTVDVGAAVQHALVNCDGTVEKEVDLMSAYTEGASVTRNPVMFLGAPTADGKNYAVGHTDVVGVRRVFIVPIDFAEEMAQGMLQEIAHVKSRAERKTLADALERMAKFARSGTDMNDIIEEMADIVAAA